MWCLPQKFFKRCRKIESRKREKICEANKQKKVGIIIDKVNFRAKKLSRDKEGAYINVKDHFHQEDIPIIVLYAPNNIVWKYIKQKFLEL